MASILTNQEALQALSIVRRVNRDLATTQQRVSTGLRVNNARDNASVWAISMTLRKDVNTIHRSVDSVNLASSQLTIARTSAERIADLMSKVREMSTYLGDDTPTDKEKFAADIRSMVDEVHELLGQSGFNGEQLFDGNTRRFVTGTGATVEFGGHKLDAKTLGLDAILSAVDAATQAAASSQSAGSSGSGTSGEAAAAAAPMANGQATYFLGTPTGPVLADGAGVDGPSATPTTAPVSTGSQSDEQMLVYGTKWGGALGTGVTLTYSFRVDGVSAYDTNYDGGAPANGAYDLNAVVQTAVEAALALWSAVANVKFVYEADTATTAADLRFGGSADPATAYAYYPDAFPEAGDVWFGDDYKNLNPGDMDPGTYEFLTAVHEIGHALGLKHPHDDNITGGNIFGGAEHDHLQWSVMSYKDYFGDTNDGYSHFSGSYALGPMVADIAAIQYLYGANTSYNSDDTVYTFTPGESAIRTLWDAGGTDTIDWSAYSEGATVDLRDGQYSTLGPAAKWFEDGGGENVQTLGIAYGAIIENAVGGSGDDKIIGNAADNMLTGGRGNDVIDGGAGIDTAVFSGRSDDYEITVDANGIKVIGADGTDTLVNIEKLKFSDRTITLSAASAEQIEKAARTAMETAIEAATTYGQQQSAMDIQRDAMLSMIKQKTLVIGILVDADMDEEAARLDALNVQRQLAVQSLSIANNAASDILSLFHYA